MLWWLASAAAGARLLPSGGSSARRRWQRRHDQQRRARLVVALSDQKSRSSLHTSQDDTPGTMQSPGFLVPRRYGIMVRTHFFNGFGWHLAHPICYLRRRCPYVRHALSLIRARDATRGNHPSDGLVTLPACCACLLAGIGQRRQATRHENALAFRRRCFFGACPMRTGAPWFCDLSPFGASTPVLATWANTL